jgi:hypothetical protein
MSIAESMFLTQDSYQGLAGLSSNAMARSNAKQEEDMYDLCSTDTKLYVDKERQKFAAHGIPLTTDMLMTKINNYERANKHGRPNPSNNNLDIHNFGIEELKNEIHALETKMETKMETQQQDHNTQLKEQERKILKATRGRSASTDKMPRPDYSQSRSNSPQWSNTTTDPNTPPLHDQRQSLRERFQQEVKRERRIARDKQHDKDVASGPAHTKYNTPPPLAYTQNQGNNQNQNPRTQYPNQRNYNGRSPSENNRQGFRPRTPSRGQRAPNRQRDLSSNITLHIYVCGCKDKPNCTHQEIWKANVPLYRKLTGNKNTLPSPTVSNMEQPYTDTEDLYPDTSHPDTKNED